MGDVNQLSPVVMKSIADGIGTFTLSKFMDPPNKSKTVNFKFHITDVVRQKEK